MLTLLLWASVGLAAEDRSCSMKDIADCVSQYEQNVASGVVKDDRQQPWNLPAVFVEDSIYQRDSAFDVYRRVNFPIDGLDKHENKAIRANFNKIFKEHRPSEHSFFTTLRNAPREVATSPHVLREIYIRYQAAMHTTRAAVYFSPYLNSPQLRQRKAKIILDDDTVNELASHHIQLENLFRSLGAECIPHEEEFGDLPELRLRLDPDLARWSTAVEALYHADLGAWTTVEILSDDWISAFSQSYAPHYGKGFVLGLQYFDEITTGHVEIQHMLETLALLEDTVIRHPDIEASTQAHATQMAQELDSLWDNLEIVVKNATSFFTSMRPEAPELRTCAFFNA
jgi:hypothetical protein